MKLQLTSSFLIIGIAPMIACSSDSGGSDSGDDDAFILDLAGTHTQYVADTIIIPTMTGQSGMLALDIDKDGRPDNGLGNALSALANEGVDLQPTVTDGVNTGSSIILADLQATALDNASGVGLRFYLGGNPNPPACSDVTMPDTCGMHLMGGASFDFIVGSPDDALIGGRLIDGTFKAQAPGTVTLNLSFVEGKPPTTLKLIGTRTEFTVKADGTMSGELVGAISPALLSPVASQLIIDLITKDCIGTFPDCCTADSPGKFFLDLIDSNDEDCMVTSEQVASNSIIRSLLSPDVDMFNGTTFDPGVDGVDDSISLGLGFSAVGATFARP